VLRYNNQALGGPSFETLNGSVVVTAQQGELNVYSSLEGLHTIQVFDILGRELLTALLLQMRCNIQHLILPIVPKRYWLK